MSSDIKIFEYIRELYSDRNELSEFITELEYMYFNSPLSKFKIRKNEKMKIANDLLYIQDCLESRVIIKQNKIKSNTIKENIYVEGVVDKELNNEDREYVRQKIIKNNRITISAHFIVKALLRERQHEIVKLITTIIVSVTTTIITIYVRSML